MSSGISKIEKKQAERAAREARRLSAEDLKLLHDSTQRRIDLEIAARKAAARLKQAEGDFEVEAQEHNALVTGLIRKYGGKPTVDQIDADGLIVPLPPQAAAPR